MNSAAELCGKAYHSLFECTGLCAIHDRKLSKGRCAYILRQYQKYVEAFPRLLAIGISKLESDEARLPLVENLWEEHGEGDLGKAHRNLFKVLLSRIAAVSPTVIEILSCEYDSSIKNFVLACEKTLLEGSAATAMGFLGPGTEGATPELYAILPRLLNPFQLESEDTFFAPHCELDVRHAELFAPAIDAVLRTAGEQGKREYVGGVEAALALERIFWDGVVEESQRIRF